MNEEIPEGAIQVESPEEEIPQGAIPIEEPGNEQIPEGAIPVQEPPSHFQTAKQAIQSGITLGGSTVARTHGLPALGIAPSYSPERAREIEEANPITNFLGEAIGTGLLIGATGGVGAAGAATRGVRLGLSALEGAGISGVHSFNDDWSQNKPLDAEKIAVHSTIGGFLGLGGGLLGEVFRRATPRKLSIGEPELPGGGRGGGSGSYRGPHEPLVQAPRGVEAEARNAVQAVAEDLEAPVIAPYEKGPAPTTIEEIAERNARSRSNGTGQVLGKRAIAEDALTRLDMGDRPVLPAQLESLDNSAKTDIWGIVAETPTYEGSQIKQYEIGQKNEILVPGIQKTIEDLAPGTKASTSWHEGGSKAADALSDTLVPLRALQGKIVGEIKKLKIEDINHLPDLLTALMGRIPGIAEMLRFDSKTQKFIIRPWTGAMSLPRRAHQNIKRMIETIQKDSPNLEKLFNLRDSLEEGVNMFDRRNGGAQISDAKAVMLDYIQDLVDTIAPVQVRGAFKNYAKTMEDIKFIENKIGAQVGDDFRSLAKDKPEENILGKIFSNTETVKAVKRILPKDKFNALLKDYLNLTKKDRTKLDIFSSNRFGSFLKNDADVLRIAFEGNPASLQRLHDLTNVAMIFPDRPPTVVGSGKVNLHLVHGLLKGDLLGVASSVLKKTGMKKLDNYFINQALNKAIAGTAEKSYWANSLKNASEKITKLMDNKIEALFAGFAANSSKVMPDDGE